MQLLPIISEFIAAVGTSSDLEIYNSAGLRYELALHLKTQLPPELYGVHLSRKLKEVATPSGIPEAERQRIDLYVFHRDKREQYGINLKLLKMEEKLTRLTVSEEVKSLELLINSGLREAYSMLVAPSHLLAEVEKTAAPVPVAEYKKLKESLGRENNSLIRFLGQVPWQLLRLPCTGDSVQWYYALIKNVK